MDPIGTPFPSKPPRLLVIRIHTLALKVGDALAAVHAPQHRSLSQPTQSALTPDLRHPLCTVRAH